jgi:NAD(P)-dependent dehydrogenase (short-subunit alcohol dehydrogenase family)
MNEYILITGASSGIGRQIAILLSNTYNLILHGRDEIRLNETKTHCNTENKLVIWKYDLNEISLIEPTLGDFIRLNEIQVIGFVHCAGFLKMVPIKMYSIQTMLETMNINFFAAVQIVKVLINKKSNHSALKNVVFISSTASTMGAKAFSIYSASKGALDSYMRCLAVELAPKVRANSILPGGIQTEMTEQIFQDQEVISRLEATYPLGLGHTSDIAEMADFLLSEKSRWITGQQFVVDGGRSINISG